MARDNGSMKDKRHATNTHGSMTTNPRIHNSSPETTTMAFKSPTQRTARSATPFGS